MEWRTKKLNKNKATWRTCNARSLVLCVIVDEWRFLHSLVTFTFAIINFVSVWTHFRCVFAHTHTHTSTLYTYISSALTMPASSSSSSPSPASTNIRTILSLTYITNEDAMIGGQFSAYLPLFFSRCLLIRHDVDGSRSIFSLAHVSLSNAFFFQSHAYYMCRQQQQQWVTDFVTSHLDFVKKTNCSAASANGVAPYLCPSLTIRAIPQPF